MLHAKYSLLIVDDHPLLRCGLTAIINGQDDMAVHYEASSAREGLEIILNEHPDLAIVDISLEGKSGLELLRDVRNLRPELPVIMFSMHEESVYTSRALRAGARGYVMKSEGGKVLLAAVRRVLAGGIYVSDRMAADLISRFAGDHPHRNSPIDSLTDREFEVFQLIGLGCAPREVAGRLHISLKTVDVYRQHLKEKFHLPNSVALIQHAVRWAETEKLFESV